ncbi:ATP-binding protein [Streptomyces sp. NPDC003717]|uniref:ATP-binding protein n=1 Tax=Streptomyces sp. NPDC003717 TaxID=3154276 RepID=UPI0033A1EDA2
MTPRRVPSEDGKRTATVVYPRMTESVPQARRFVVATAIGWRQPHLVDTAELVVSELAANVVLHTDAPSFRVTLTRLSDDRLRVAVSDPSRNRPARCAADDSQVGGRGLALVDAVSARWDTDMLVCGKSVWAELAAPPASPLPETQGRPLRTSVAQGAHILGLAATAGALIYGIVSR